jgi:hypothetical protein
MSRKTNGFFTPPRRDSKLSTESDDFMDLGGLLDFVKPKKREPKREVDALDAAGKTGSYKDVINKGDLK